MVPTGAPHQAKRHHSAARKGDCGPFRKSPTLSVSSGGHRMSRGGHPTRGPMVLERPESRVPLSHPPGRPFRALGNCRGFSIVSFLSISKKRELLSHTLDKALEDTTQRRSRKRCGTSHRGDSHRVAIVACCPDGSLPSRFRHRHPASLLTSTPHPTTPTSGFRPTGSTVRFRCTASVLRPSPYL